MNPAQTIGSRPLAGIPGVRVIDVDELPAHLAGAVRLGPGFEARPGAVLIGVPQFARYLVSNGVAIEVAPMPGAERAAVELFLDGPARGALIHQRGELPLLSTTVVSPDGRCVALCGYTAIGKSTVAAALTKRGWALLGEGITRLALSGGKVVAHPSHDALRLWQHACEILNINSTSLRRTRRGFEKFYVPVRSVREPAIFYAIASLQPDPRTREEADQRMLEAGEGTGLSRVLELGIFRQSLVAALGTVAEHQRVARTVGEQTRFAVVEGARKATPDELADRIEGILA